MSKHCNFIDLYKFSIQFNGCAFRLLIRDQVIKRKPNPKDFFFFNIGHNSLCYGYLIYYVPMMTN